MRKTVLLLLALCGAFYCAGCQITVEDLTPFELRKGGGESVEPKPPEPKPPEPKPPAAGKDVIYMLGINGIDWGGWTTGVVDALKSQAGITDAFTVIEEFTLYLHGTAESKLNKDTLAKMISEDFGYELVSFKEDRAGDWAGLKKKYGIK